MTAIGPTHAKSWSALSAAFHPTGDQPAKRLGSRVMRFTVQQRADAHDVPGPVTDYLGRVVPLRLGELAYTAKLEAVEYVDRGEVVLTFDLPDSDLRWEAVSPPRAGRGRVASDHAVRG